MPRPSPKVRRATAPAPSMDSERVTGRLKKYMDGKGFGFIETGEGGMNEPGEAVPRRPSFTQWSQRCRSSTKSLI